jgi:thioredoxin 2
MSALSMDDRGVIVVCPQCGKKNRLPFDRLDASGQCGQCHGALKVTAPVEVGSGAAFERLVSSSSVPVLVDFWAPWCGPCKMVAPELEKAASANNGRYVIAKVNTDALPDLGSRFRIGSIPTMAVFRGGQELSRVSGARPAAAIDIFVRQAAGL